MKIQYETELYHHGILGQKWGIRRFQNHDGSLTPRGRAYYNKRRQASDLVAKTIPAGTKTFRISTKEEPGVMNDKDAYVAYLPVDRNNVRAIAPWLMTVRGKKLEDVYERELELTKDIKLAPYEEVAAIRREMMAKKKYREEASLNQTDQDFRARDIPEQDIADVRRIYTGQVTSEEVAKERVDRAIQRNMEQGNDEAVNYLKTNRDTIIADAKDSFSPGLAQYDYLKKDTDRILKEVGTKKLSEVSDSDRLYANRVMSMVYGKDGINKKDLRAELQKRGYDGMYDNAMISIDTGAAQEAFEPIIVFDGGRSMKEISGRNLTRSELLEAKNANDKWMRKVGQDGARQTLRKEKAAYKQAFKERKEEIAKAKQMLRDEKATIKQAYKDYRRQHPGSKMKLQEYMRMTQKAART